MPKEGGAILSPKKLVRRSRGPGTKVKDAGKKGLRFFLNGIPAHWVNTSYNVYSRIYQGQLRRGLPVPKKLLESQEERTKLRAPPFPARREGCDE